MNTEQDQGFISNILEISHKSVEQYNTSYFQPSDYEPRYIKSQGIFRKQPTQSFHTPQQLTFSIDYSVRQKSKSYSRGEIGHPYNKYFTNSNYKLIYSKTREKIIDSNDNHFCRNQISLKSMLSRKQSQYVTFKPFQYRIEQQKMQDQLIFDSKFESGNLQWTFKKKDSQQYVLFIQNDTNTYGYNQWFYFSIRNMAMNTCYKFRIVNFKKKHSFFRKGKPLAIFSLINAQKFGEGWKYGGNNINYDKSEITNCCQEKYYTLSFQLSAQHDKDYIMVSLNLPYSYSKLIHKLQFFKQLSTKNDIKWDMNSISYSLSCNAVPYITVTKQKEYQSKKGNKKMIIFMARQHPGQTWSSYLMEQIINQLLNGNDQSNWLLQNYIIKLFPMVNVDGVIYGNFRCDLGGFDLNRSWKTADKVLHPQVEAIKTEIINLSKKYEIVCCFDLHGHSKQYNSFCYSCKKNQISCRVLPLIFNQLNPQFYFPFCTFGISRCKQKTARAIIFNTIDNQNVLTIQCSFFGSKIGQEAFVYNPKSMKNMAKTIIKGCKIYFNEDPLKKQVENIIKSKLRELIEYQLVNGDEAGSQSDPEGDQIKLSEKIGKIIPLQAVKREKNEEKIRQCSNQFIEQRIIQKNTTPIQLMYPNQKNASETDKRVLSLHKISPQQRKFDKKSTQKQNNDNNYVGYKKYTEQINKKVQTNAKIQKAKARVKHHQAFSQEKAPFRVQEKSFQFDIPNNSQISQLQKIRQKRQLKNVQFRKEQPLVVKQGSQQLYRKPFFSSKKHIIRDEQSAMTIHSQQKKIIFLKNEDKQQFPNLCILASTQKNNHFLQTSKLLKKGALAKIQKKTTYYSKQFPQKKQTDKRREDRQIISKIWLENVVKYGRRNNIFANQKLGFMK